MANRFSLQRACINCTKAKRPCDRQTPSCNRCSRLTKSCVYLNEPLASNTNIHALPTNASVQVCSNSLLPGQPATLWLPRSPSQSVLNTYITSSVGPTTLHHLRLKLESFSQTFSESPQTPFIHSHLYKPELPIVLQHAYHACRSISGLHNQERYVLVQSLFTSISQRGTIAELQALLLLLSALLAHKDSTMWTLAQSFTRTVLTLANRIWSDALKQVPESMNCWETWIVSESVRRTVLTAFMVVGICQELNFGHFELPAFFPSLLFEKSSQKWGAKSPDEWASVGRVPSGLVSFREFTYSLEEDRSAAWASFEGFLTTACSGHNFNDILSGSDFRINVETHL